MAVADFAITILTFIVIYSLFGIGLNVKYGFTGLIDFGHVAYFMIGAYVTVVLTMPTSPAGYRGLGGFALPQVFGFLPGGDLVGWLVGLGGGMLAAALVSLLVGIPTLRLREDYLAITALGVATILNAVVRDEQWLFNGPFGIRDIHQPLAGAFPISPVSFPVSLAIFGIPSLAIFGYGSYRLWGVIRQLSLRAAGIGTAGGLVFVAGFAAIAIDFGDLGLGVGGVALLVAGGYVARIAFRETESPGALAALLAAELFVVWYFLTPLVQQGAFVLLRNTLFFYDPTAGPHGGLDYDRFLLLFGSLLLVAAYYWVERTVNSPYGRVLRSIREDEDVPAGLGKDTFRYKLQSLAFGSALAGAAGGLWATNIGFIDPSQFAATVTFFAFTAVIIGGTANNRGVVLGTVVFWSINAGTRFLDDYFPSKYAIQLAAARLILIGVLLIVILYYRPQGILGEQEYPIRGLGGGTDD